MAYTPTYDANDIANASIDVAGNFIAALAAQAGTLATLVVIGAVIAVVSGLFLALWGLFRGLVPQQRRR